MNTFQVEYTEAEGNEVTLKLIPHSHGVAGVTPAVIEVDLPAIEHTIVAEESLLGAALDQYVLDYDIYAIEVVESPTSRVLSMASPYSHQALSTQCGCGEGRASAHDGVCKFCRELKYSRAQGKSVNVKHKGDGMSLDQEAVLLGTKKRHEVYI